MFYVDGYVFPLIYAYMIFVFNISPANLHPTLIHYLASLM